MRVHTRSSASLGLVAVVLALGACKHEPKPSAHSPAAAPPSAPATGDAAPKAAEPASAPNAPVPAASAAPAAHGFATVEDYTKPALSTLELPNGLVIDELKIGDGAPVFPGATATFHYRSKVKDGAEFDATAERAGGPALQNYPLKSMMPGIRDGVVGMKVGGRRRLTIPAELAFGWLGQKDGSGNVVVPSDATVIFVIDMVDTKLVLAPAGAPKAK